MHRLASVRVTTVFVGAAVAIARLCPQTLVVRVGGPFGDKHTRRDKHAVNPFPTDLQKRSLLLYLLAQKGQNVLAVGGTTRACCTCWEYVTSGCVTVARYAMFSCVRRYAPSSGSRRNCG
jgi:hypothetical protein